MRRPPCELELLLGGTNPVVSNYKLSFYGVGWAAGELVGETSSETAAGKRRYTLYVERATFAVL